MSPSAPPNMTAFPRENHYEMEDQSLDVIPTRAGRKLCVRHKQMANQNINEKLQRSLDSLNPSERAAITQMWSTFSTAPHGKRKIILEGILTMCCFSQLSHLSDSLNQIIRIDPFSLLPRETSLRILGYLDAFSLGRAAQVSRLWKALADDDLLWRRMCGQHIDRKCDKCGWGLPLLERKRLKVELKDRSPAGLVEHDHKHENENGQSRLVTRDQVLSSNTNTVSSIVGLKSCDTPAMYLFPPNVSAGTSKGIKRASPESSTGAAKKVKVNGSDSEAEIIKPSSASLTREVRLTRPWKTVYCERLMVERNWRKGRCSTKVLKGHTDGVMCLQYHTALTNPSYPVLITGSYDRTVRVWNLDTGEEVRVLRGHTRAVRALQFDQMLLFTGAMDGTVRMWNWRAGECLRVMDGHTDGVISLNYNGYLLATGSADSTINVWNFRTGNRFTLRGHEEWVNNVVLWDGKTTPSDTDPAAIPSFTQAVSNRCQKSKSPAAVSNEPTLPDIDPGAMLFSSSDDMTIKLWDLETATCLRTFEGHKAQVQSLKVLMVDMTEEEVAARDRRQRRQITPSTSGFTTGSRVSPPPGTHGSSAALDDVPAGFDALEHRGRSRSDAVQPRVYVHSPDGTHKKSEREQSHSREKKAILASGSLDGTVKIWDVETGREQSTLFGHIEGVWAIDIDALRLVSASHDRTIKVWEKESAQCMQTLVGHRGAVTSLQLSDDMIVSGSDDGDVMVWNFAASANNVSNTSNVCESITPSTTPAIV
ncbi:F-box and WD-40 domain-containing protein MET30 [Cryptococcus deuterogattii 99/473]|uniref:F-box and WD-40 domain-containing protein MET30 n=1 Tax=Cryptococcus deuterogattii Ram5 TaxID=1296110 RepID=A0A0D0UYP6_9TREE|nr:F-box and WD-40 domain-containing protein MET30 [Cryptococcus deuterogattii Ram5]KIY58657.1 F-box and WD-40 domain-containing protein MET30 [Cryptococcus deuterogattii 99/473]